LKIGISGHQNLGTADVIDWTRAQMRHELLKRDFACGLTSLADGADQLFAEVVLSLGKPLEVIIPCKNYEAAFTSLVARKRFRNLKHRVSKAYVLDFEHPSEEAFYQAGRRIVELSDLMIFVWNGKPAKGHGGTADIIAYADQSSRPYVRIDPTKAPTSRAH